MKLPRFWKSLAILVVASVAVAGLATSLSIVGPSDVGVVLRFGKITHLVDPGLHFTVPFGFGRVVDVPTQRLLKEELGHDSQEGAGLADESELLTGELDRVAMQWAVQYRITDPMDYLSQVRTPGCAVRALSVSVMGTLVGDRATQEVLSEDHRELEDEAKRLLQGHLDRYRGGVEVEGVLVLGSGPPAEGGQPLAERSFDSCRVEQASAAHRDAFTLAPLFVLPEWERALLFEFGKPVGSAITEPGLHFKLPLVRRVRLVDRRLLIHELGIPEQLTQDARAVWVSAFVYWRITDPSIFHQRLESEIGARARLDNVLDGEIRDAIASHELVELVRSSDRLPPLIGRTPPAPTPGKRDTVRQVVLEAASGRVRDLGLEIVGVHLTIAL